MRWRTLAGLLATTLTIGLTNVVPVASAADTTPSDSRATVGIGDPTTCADVGLPGSTLFDGPVGIGGADAPGKLFHHTLWSRGEIDLAAPTLLNHGTWIKPSGLLNLANVSNQITITAVVVKNLDGYQLYRSAVPNMIASLRSDGKVPHIKSWFVCYVSSLPLRIGQTVRVRRPRCPRRLGRHC